MINKTRILDKERIFRHLTLKGSSANTYKLARELEMEREGVLELLNELAQEGKVRLRSGSVLAINSQLSEEENVRTKSEVEELKERMDKLEKWVGFTFSQVEKAFQNKHQKISRKNQLNPEDIRVEQ